MHVVDDISRGSVRLRRGGSTAPVSAPVATVADAAVGALSEALLAFDPYTAEHSSETLMLAVRVAERLEVEAEEAELIERVAALHDVGKIGIPSAVLQKRGPLDDEERAIVQEHPVIGERILRRVPGLDAVATAIRHEHERWDGGGYPDGLAGTSIPLASRIVLACDAWHAMTSDRPYRLAMDHEDAKEELRRCAGSQFDPDVTRALLEVLEQELSLAF